MPWWSWIVSNVLLALLLALAAWVAQRWLRRPGVAHMLWVLVLVKLLTPPVVSLSAATLDGNLACRNGTCQCGPHAQPAADDTLLRVWLAVWLAGAAATGVAAWRRWARLQRLLAHAVPAPLEWQALTARLAAELSLRRPPEVLAVPGRLPPLVVPGWRRPRLLIPTTLMARLEDPQRTVLVLHELVHLVRRDHLVRLLELAVGVVYWWLPIVGPIGRQLRACEEACCDAAVVAREPEARRDYARLLLDVLDFVAPLPRAVARVTAMSAACDLERRLRAILGPSPTTATRWPVGVVAVGLACVVLPCELPLRWATPVEREPAPSLACSPDEGGVRKPLKEFCCP
jgi:beta-lactamase regulating signal transducer with metallopeptidase domain